MAKTRSLNLNGIKATISMEQVLQHYGVLQLMNRNNNDLVGRCPIHGGKDPTHFRISLSENTWNCIGECRHGGNVIDFVAVMESVGVAGAASRLIEWFNLDPHDVAF